MSESATSHSPTGRQIVGRRPWLGIVSLAVACIALAGASYVWHRIQVRDRHQAQCLENVKQIVLAFHNYHDTYGQFPPAYLVDRSGRPAHSWRVLLLPFLDQQALYDRYRFDEPWNGPHNRGLSAEAPRVFHCPAAEPPSGNSDYVVVTGDGTVFPGDRSTRISGILDGTGNTILFAETADSQTNWLEPRDLTYDEALAGINPPKGRGISSRHGRFAMVAMADGTIWAIPDNLSRDTLSKLLLRNDGQIIPEFGMKRGSVVESAVPPPVPPPAPPLRQQPPRGEILYR